jgi:electron transport complex protein RnfE
MAFRTKFDLGFFTRLADLARYREIALDGLWRNNPAWVALLGLCPLLAVSSTVVNGLGLGLATTMALLWSNGLISLIRQRVTHEIRLPVFVLVIASNVTLIELLMKAYFYELHQTLGIFIPLIVTNCAIMGRAESFASRNPVDRALADGLFIGLGFSFVLILLGALREVIGTGTLLNRAELLFGRIAKDWTLVLFEDYEGCLLAILPPGAFIGLGLLVAMKNVIDAKHSRR